MTKKQFRKWSKSYNNSESNDKEDNMNSSVIYDNINLGNNHIYEVLHTVLQIGLQEAKVIVSNNKLGCKKSGYCLDKNRSNYDSTHWNVPVMEYVGKRSTHFNIKYLCINYSKKYGTKLFKQELKYLPLAIKFLKRSHKADAWLTINDSTFFSAYMFCQIGNNICNFVQQFFGKLLNKHTTCIYENVAKDLIHAVEAYKEYGDMSIGLHDINLF